MPEDRRMTISSSSPLSPDEVARRTFATSRRGYAPDEVRAYLDTLAQSLRGTAEREHDLRRALEDAEHRAANPVLDEETLAASLGQETSRVLKSAHEAAHEMVGKATAEAERLLAEAHAEIAATESRVSEQLADRVAQTDAATAEARRRAEDESAAALDRARSEAEALVDEARVHCRDMVEEAQALRARLVRQVPRGRREPPRSISGRPSRTNFRSRYLRRLQIRRLMLWCWLACSFIPRRAARRSCPLAVHAKRFGWNRLPTCCIWCRQPPRRLRRRR